MSDSERSIAELVDALFKTYRTEDGEEYSYQEVSAALGGELHPSYIYKVRMGKILNPGRNALILLGRFFRVPASYFFPELQMFAPVYDDVSADDQLKLALRSAGLSSNAQRYIEGLVQELRQRT